MGRLVLFGAAGFIGSALRQTLGAEAVTPRRGEVDLAEPAGVERFLRAGDVIVNAAGSASATDRSPDGLARIRRDNVEAVRSLAEAATAVGADRLVHISSVAAMGHREGHGLTEGEMVQPRSPYSLSKLHAERILADYADRLSITVLRPTSVFGEGRGLALSLCRVAALPVVPLPTGGRALVPFTYVGNVAEAVRLAVRHEATRGGTFIVGDAGSYPLRDIAMGLARGQGAHAIRVVPVPRSVLTVAAAVERITRRGRGAPILGGARIDTLTRSVSYSIDAFVRATGYRPPVSMEEATERIGAWYVRSRRGV
jgi:nucleoside-diphosphate-sugar epimerase